MGAGARGSSGNAAWGWVAAAVIILLILGYIPLARRLFDHRIQVEYSLRINGQYDGPGGSPVPLEGVDLARASADGSYLIGGLLWERRYLSLSLDGTGTAGSRLALRAELDGLPEQLWLNVDSVSGGRYHARPLYLGLLEDGGWSKLEGDGLTLYQRGERFTAMGDFLDYAASRPGEAIGLAGLSPEEVMRLAPSGGGRPGGGTAAPAERELLAMPLRGGHTLQCMVEGGRLSLEVAKRDLNRYPGSDAVTVRVSRGGEVLRQERLEDDGNLSDDWAVPPQEYAARMELEGMDDGPCLVEISGEAGGGSKDDDFIITRVSTDAARAVFAGRLFLFDPGEIDPLPVISYPQAAVWMSSPQAVLSASTMHGERERTVSVAGQRPLRLAGMSGSTPVVRTEVSAGEKRLDLANPGSIILECAGAGFSCLPEALFDPSFSWMRPVKDYPEEAYGLVLTRGYASPEPTPTGAVVSAEVETAAGEGPAAGRAKMVLEKQGEAVILTSLRIRLE